MERERYASDRPHSFLLSLPSLSGSLLHYSSFSMFSSIISPLCCFLTSPFLLVLLFGVFSLLFFAYRNSSVDVNRSRSFFGRFKVGGHRGVIGAQPENSIAAFQKALDSGADTIELDVMLTSDKKAVIMHDDTTDRTTNGKRVVENTSYEDIRRLRLIHNTQETSEKVPTLDEALSFVKKNKLNVVIDVKDHSEEMVNEISRLIIRYSLHDRAIVSSFNPLVPFLIKKADDRILTGITFRRWAWSTLTEDDSVKRHPFYINWLYGVMDTINYYGIISMITPSFLGTEMILANHLDISPKLVSRAFHHGFQVVSWTSNSVAEAKFYRSIKVPLLTDLPEVMNAVKGDE
ncbi:hypothetical protein PRIPAC_74652 [Pristionchus pacificus]|uniref:GP-PDE domain-containing protein n=1 Tax=Pristionchus pacificus TaxID=54126 RepID=A0A2A6CR62_PRIPA|nr:hypothetical protein PRIPAC_74652 [Pristionchus pacificus]|eukprot:PDM80533.1 hypothetical protein PRIPAC_35536 [Pristionchus pacificus]